MPGLSPENPVTRSLRTSSCGARISAIAAVALAATFLFWWAAQRHSHRFNTDSPIRTVAKEEPGPGEPSERKRPMMEKHDQLAIMTFARRVHRSFFTPGAQFYSGTRNKMPLYPLIQSLFLPENDATESDADFFEKGKTINIIITMAGLACVAWLFFRSFSFHLATNLTLIAAFSVFVYKAAYFQPDTLAYFLAFGVFLLIWRLLVSGGIFTALVCGILLALAHYCKGTAPPLLALFVVFFGGAQAFAAFQKLRHRDSAAPNRPLWRGCVEMALVVGVSLALLSPYLIESQQRFQKGYFYNVNSTFYMWLDSWAEAKKFSEMYDDRHQTDTIPPDQMPGPAKYLRDHTVGQIITRFWKGMAGQVRISLHSYGYAIYILALGGVLGYASWKQGDRVRRFLAKQPFLAAYLVAYFGGYFVLFSWYEYVGRGQRFILGLFLPALFVLGYGYRRLVENSPLVVSIRSVERPLATVANWAVTAYLLVDIVYTVSYEIVSRNGGS